MAAAVICWGMDVSVLLGEMRQTKFQILVWSSEIIQCPYAVSRVDLDLYRKKIRPLTY